jgi:hypothetical protein
MTMFYWVVTPCRLVGRYVLEEHAASIFRDDVTFPTSFPIHAAKRRHVPVSLPRNWRLVRKAFTVLQWGAGGTFRAVRHFLKVAACAEVSWRVKKTAQNVNKDIVCPSGPRFEWGNVLIRNHDIAPRRTRSTVSQRCFESLSTFVTALWWNHNGLLFRGRYMETVRLL